MKQLTIGILMVLTAIWGGGYILWNYPGTWVHFPAFFTAAMLFVGGIILAVSARVFNS